MDRALQPTVYQYNGFSGTYWWVFGLYLLGKMKYTGQYLNKIWVNMSVNDVDQDIDQVSQLVFD